MKRMGPIMILAAGLFLFSQVAQADWTRAKRITRTSGRSLSPAIAIDSSNTIHVVWTDHTPGNGEIYYKKSTDRGATWSPAQRLTWTSGWSFDAAIAIDSSNTIHVVWEDDTLTPGRPEIYYQKSTDGGVTWSTSQNITQNSGWSYSPDIAVDSSKNIHVVWIDDHYTGNYEACYKKSTDGGATWSAGENLTYSEFNDCSEPSIFVDSFDNLHVVASQPYPWWIVGTDTEICYMKSADAGVTWMYRIINGNNSGYSEKPKIAVDSSNNPHVVWCDNTPGNYEIYYNQSTDGGDNWATSKKLTQNSGWSYSPDISVDPSNNPHVVWSDSSPGNLEIFYRKSTNRGATWTPRKRLTWTSSMSQEPDIAVDSHGDLHLVWEDNKPGNFEIYYMKFIK